MFPNPIFGHVYMYGVMIALGVLACFLMLELYAKVKKTDPRFVDFIFYNGIACIVVGFGSSALFQAVYNYIAHPELGFKFGNGITFIGGLIGGAVSFLLGYFLFGRGEKYKSSLMDVVSYLPGCILIAHGFGRLGCFCAGCCFGRPTDSFLGVVFKPGSGAYDKFGDTPLHPTQLYEAAFLFIMFALITWLVIRHDFRQSLPLYLASYGVFRFLIEYVRDDERGQFIGSLSPSQFWSILMVVLGVALFFIFRVIFARMDERRAAEASQETA